MGAHMEPIGGFFELELPRGKSRCHGDALGLTSGRSCLNLIIQESNPKKIYLPYYSCDSLLEPIRLSGIAYEYYRVNSLLDPILPNYLNTQDYILYINYFGLKTTRLKALVGMFGKRLIVDNTQAFFENGYSGQWVFNSCRKFFGVPDGAFLYSPHKILRTLRKNTHIRCDYLLNRLLGKDAIAYRQFLRRESEINIEPRYISELSIRILSNVNFSQVKKTRRSNFEFLHSQLGPYNRFKCDYPSESVPLCYPFLPPKTIDKKIFYDQKIYIPTYWKRLTKKRTFKLENDFADRLLPLPVDHRYNHYDLQRVVELTLKLIAQYKIAKIGKL